MDKPDSWFLLAKCWKSTCEEWHCKYRCRLMTCNLWKNLLENHFWIRKTFCSQNIMIKKCANFASYVKFCKKNSLQNIDTLMNLENVSMQSWWKKFPFIFGFTCVVSITCHSAIFTLILAKIEIAKVKKPFKFQKTSKLKKANKQIKNKHKMLTCKSANFQLFSAVSLILGVISWYIFPNHSFCWDCFWEWGSTWFFRLYERGGGISLGRGIYWNFVERRNKLFEKMLWKYL